MLNVILTAGKAVRMGPLAPNGCKALVEFRDRPMIEWQLDVLGDATIVCRSEHADLLQAYGPTVIDNSTCGPVRALRKALEFRCVTEPVTVIYADSWFDSLPSEDEWVGVGTGHGGREWDVIHGDDVAYRRVREGDTAKVCVGLYRFADPWRLAWRVADVTSQGRIMGMPAVLSSYRVPERFIASWQDVGTPEALRAAA